MCAGFDPVSALEKRRPLLVTPHICPLLFVFFCFVFNCLGLESLQMPPTPPSSHGSDSEGSQSPVHAPPGLSCPTSPTSPAPTQAALKASPRASSCLSNSPLLTAPHVRT